VPATLRAAGHPYPKIDKALGRRAGATQQRLEIAGYGSGNARSRSISEGLLAEREALAAARTNARSVRISWAIRRPVTRRYTARQGCDRTADYRTCHFRKSSGNFATFAAIRATTARGRLACRAFL
jgi:hypothetical protein